MKPLLVALAALLVGASSVRAQQTPIGDVQASGVSFVTYAEPGAPTIDVRVVGEGVRTGIYRLQEGTTLTDLIALSGGVPTSEEDERRIVEAYIRVLREQGGSRAVIYEALTEQALREPGAHPPFRDGDLVELDVTYEEVPQRVTLGDILSTASRVASLVTAVILIYTRVDRL